MVLDTAASRILNDAASQHDRIAGAPAPEKVAVDGRSVAQLIAFAVRYGALVNFFDLQDRPQGDWVPFFATDPSVVLATHAALDLAGIERDLLRQLHRAQHDPARLAGVIVVLARLLAIFYQSAIPPVDAEAQLRDPGVLNRDDPLTGPLQRLNGHLGNDSLEGALARRGQAGDSRWHDSLFEILDDLAVTLIGALRHGQAAAVAALEISLHTGGHAPQAALWNTFAYLFSEARAELNAFPRRLVDFYYNEVLQQKGISAVPDQLFLTFTPAQAADQASVPRDARFPAGTDSNGLAINYAADAALEVSPAKVIGMSVHRITASPDNIAAGDLSLPAVLSGEVALDPAAPGTIKPFPMFGGDIGAANGSLEMKAASLGFSISSPVLMLTGGARRIEIGLVIVMREFALTDDGKPPLTPDVSSEPPGQSPGLLMTAELVALSLQQTFAFYYSTAGGWIEIDGFDVTPQLAREAGQDSRFIISFNLPVDAPPLVAPGTKLVGDPPPGLLPLDSFPDPLQVPTVIGNLRADVAGSSTALKLAQIKQAAALRRLEIGAVTIDVTVDGLTGLKLTAANGPADTSQNFAVFGIPPVRDAALDITAPELFVKPLDTLSVVINWAGLPVTSTGFKGYYQDYVLDADGAVASSALFDNRSFRATFSVVNPGPWRVDAKAPSQPLFATEPLVLSIAGDAPPSFLPPLTPQPSPTPVPEPDPAAPLATDVLLRVPIAFPPVADVPPYYNPATSALRLTLAEPAYAFGNILYTSNLMAATTALGQASVAGLTQGGADGKRSITALGQLSRTNAEAPDKTYLATIAPAVDTALSAMTGEALVAVRQAIAKSGATAADQAKLVADLEAALGNVTTPPPASSLLQRMTTRGGTSGQAAAVLANLVAWLDAHQQAFGAGATVPLKQARNMLGAATAIATAQAAASDQQIAVARPNMAAAVQVALTSLLPPSMPNPPWLPMAAGLSLSYTAAGRYRIGPPPTPTPTTQQLMLARDAAESATPVASDTVTFLHVEPFDRAKPPRAGGAVGLLPAVEPHDALYIQLSQGVPQVALLFILAANADGWWSDPPPTEWAQYADGQWQHVTMLSDGTNRLSNSGIITLQLLPDQPVDKPIRLRVLACGDTSNAPLVKAVIANATTASWVGPGGAQTLGIPLPAKTISKSLTSLTNIGSIDQPMQSFGGRPPATGAAFQMWMAERLRHKGFGITGWDYARLVLEAEPSLWQVAVVPAVDGATGLPAPGMVWVAAVAGPNTPNVVDPTVPLVDLTTLSNIGDVLEKSVSPFVKLAVTNPPYLRLKVTVECHFSAADTPDYWCIQLNEDLIKWLSPWPDEKLGRRPANYYMRRAIADFVRHRPYVLGVASLEVAPESDDVGLGWYFLTSSTQHAVTPIPPPLPTAYTSGQRRPHHASHPAPGATPAPRPGWRPV